MAESDHVAKHTPGSANKPLSDMDGLPGLLKSDSEKSHSDESAAQKHEAVSQIEPENDLPAGAFFKQEELNDTVSQSVESGLGVIALGSMVPPETNLSNLPPHSLDQPQVWSSNDEAFNTEAAIPSSTEPYPTLQDETLSQTPEATPTSTGADDNETLSEFAENVIFGLNQAGLTDHLDAPSQQTSQVDASDERRDDLETFFAGWDGFDTPPEPVSSGDIVGTVAQTPTEQEPIMADEDAPQVEASSHAFVGPQPRQSMRFEDDLSTKHDALADAVQAALLSIYGGEEGAGASGTAGHSVPNELMGFGATIRDPGIHNQSQSAVIDDGRSPQDVILSYFNYTSETSDATSPAQVGSTFETVDQPVAQPFRQSSNSVPNPTPDNKYGLTSEAQVVPKPQPQSANKTAAYEGPAAFSVPAEVSRPPLRSGRDNGRLLGAAGIGLIGGIAIAATLAVFLINSYGPATPPEGQSANLRPLTAGRTSSLRDERTSAARSTVAAKPVSPELSNQGELVVGDATGEAGQPVPLVIGVKSKQAAELTVVSITGVPDGSRLNAGVDAGGGNWLLPPRRLAGLTLNTPNDTRPEVQLEAQLLDSNVRTPLSEKKKFTIRLANTTPVQSVDALRQSLVSATEGVNSTQSENDRSQAVGSANPQMQGRSPENSANISPTPPSTRTASVTESPSTDIQANVRLAPQAEIEDLIREGNKKMRDGDIIMARDLYQRAVNLGDSDAALAMGRSFDPIYFERLIKKNAEPDPGKAFEWYKQAMDRGASQTARMRMDNLKQYLNR